MPDFDDRLADLARYGETTGRLDPATAVRARADRRRKRRTVAVAGLGVAVAVALTAGIAIAQPRRHQPVMEPAPWVSSLPVATTPPVVTAPVVTSPVVTPPVVTPPVVTPPVLSVPPPARPSPGSALTGPAEFDHRRAYRIVPVAAPGGLGVAAGGQVEMLDPGAVFTTAPVSADQTEWLIRVDEKGGSQCLSARADATVGIRRCNPSDPTQRVRYYPAGTDEQGHPAYLIGLGPDQRVLDRPAGGGLGAARVGTRAQVATTWSFVDQGPSTLAR